MQTIEETLFENRKKKKKKYSKQLTKYPFLTNMDLASPECPGRSRRGRTWPGRACVEVPCYDSIFLFFSVHTLYLQTYPAVR
jgi:hypothetical protein